MFASRICKTGRQVTERHGKQTRNVEQKTLEINLLNKSVKKNNIFIDIMMADKRFKKNLRKKEERCINNAIHTRELFNTIYSTLTC